MKSLSAILSLLSFYASAQIDAGDDVYKCDTSTVTLSAYIPDNLMIGSNYTIEDIPIDMDEVNSGTSLSNLSDDLYTQIIDIGFDFIFYCNSFDQLIISTNNYLSFNIGDANSYSPWNTFSIPSGNPSSLINNCILGPWMDLDPNNGGTIKYDIFGQAPFRRFVVSFEDFGYFSFSCSSLAYNGQIKLYESTNVIEIHIQNQPICSSWNNGESVLGVINEDESEYLIYPGWNNTQMTVNNEAFRFIPSGSILPTWSDNTGSIIGTGTSVNVSPTQTTKYTVTVSDCEDAYLDSVTVYVSPPIDIQATIDDNICPDEIFGSIEIITSGGTNPLAYEWSCGTNNFSSNAKNIANLEPGTYLLAITDSLGCETNSAPYIISTTPDPFLVVDSITDVNCHGFSNGMIETNVSGATPNYNYSWSGNTPFSGDGTNTISNLNKGYYTLILTDNNGCKDTSTYFVNENSPINLEINISNYNGFEVSCSGSNNGWLSIIPSGGVPPYTYSAPYLENPQMSSTDFSTSNLNAGVYEIKIKDSINCAFIKNIEINEPEKLEVKITNYSDETCTYNNDGFIEIEVTGGPDDPVYSQNYLSYDYLWVRQNESYSAQKNIYGLESDDYSVVVTDENGCTASITQKINQPYFTIADYRVLNDTVTVNHPIMNIFDNSEGNIMEWYWELDNGFISYDQDILNLDLSTELDSNGVKYFNLKLVVVDYNSCTDSTFGTLAIKDEHTLYVPNGFTPDGDDINDEFRIFHHGIKDGTFGVKIYDRWGSIIYESDNPNFGWDGTNMFTKKNLTSGAYTYLLKYKDFESKIYDQTNCENCKGTITLIR